MLYIVFLNHISACDLTDPVKQVMLYLSRSIGNDALRQVFYWVSFIYFLFTDGTNAPSVCFCYFCFIFYSYSGLTKQTDSYYITCNTRPSSKKVNCEILFCL